MFLLLMILSWQKKACFLLLIPCITAVFAQPGLKIPKTFPSVNKSDTLNIAFPEPVLPLPDLQKFNYPRLELKQTGNALNIYQYISPDFMPANPFELDLRQTSNYVPGMVRDQLNRIMDRPRDSAFLPILPVAFLALQLASKYLLIQQKTEITVENIISAEEAIPLLKILWVQSPQTLTEMYEKVKIRDNHTMRDVERLVNLLIENNLVRTRIIENAGTKYYAALQEAEYLELKKKAEVQGREKQSRAADQPSSGH